MHNSRLHSQEIYFIGLGEPQNSAFFNSASSNCFTQSWTQWGQHLPNIWGIGKEWMGAQVHVWANLPCRAARQAPSCGAPFQKARGEEGYLPGRCPLSTMRVDLEVFRELPPTQQTLGK